MTQIVLLVLGALLLIGVPIVVIGSSAGLKRRSQQGREHRGKRTTDSSAQAKRPASDDRRSLGEWLITEGDAARHAAVTERIIGAENFAAVLVSPRGAEPSVNPRIIGTVRCHGCAQPVPFEEELHMGGGLFGGQMSCTCGCDISWTACEGFFVVHPLTSLRGQQVRPIGLHVESIWDARQDIKEDAQGSVRTLGAHKAPVQCIAFSPDGSRLASGHTQGLVIISNAITGEVVRSWPAHKGEFEFGVRDIAWSLDGKRIMSAGGRNERTVCVWNAETGEQVWKADVASPVKSTVFLLDGMHVATGGSEKILIWKVETGEIVNEIAAHAGSISLAAPTTADTILSGSADGTTKLWEWASGTELKRCQGSGEIASVAQHPDGKLAAFATCSEGPETVTIWEIGSGAIVKTLRGHKSCVKSVAFVPPGSKLISSSYDGTVRIWDLQSGNEIACLSGGKECLALSPDGRHVAIGATGNSIEIRELSLT